MLDWVEQGGEVAITRLGRAVARLVPSPPGDSREDARADVEGMREMSKGMTRGGVSTKDMIDEGRV